MPNTVSYDERRMHVELLNFLRGVAMTVDPQNRVSLETTTEQYVDLDNGKLVVGESLSHVENVVFDGGSLAYGKDYLFHYDDDILKEETGLKGTIELLGTYNPSDEITFTYGTTAGSKSNLVYPDFPRIDLNKKSYPRVGFHTTTSTSPRGTTGGTQYTLNNNITIQIRVVATTQRRVKAIQQRIRNKILERHRGFYSFKYIKPTSQNTLNNFNEDNTQNSYYQEAVYEVPNQKEVITPT